MFYPRKQLETDLHILLGIVVALIIIGGLFIYSASLVYALETSNTSHYFVKKQAIGIVLGILGIIIIRLIPLSLIKKLTPIFALTVLGLTTLTLFPGLSQTIHGSSRWLNIGIVPFQPSELLKIALILFTGYSLEGKNLQHRSFWLRSIPFFLVIMITCLVLLKQPDFGLTITLVLTIFMLFFIAKFSIKHTIIFLFGLGITSSILIFLRPYRLQRILTFLNPWQDPKGAGFQIIQSLIAIGTGNWIGTGIAHSKQKFFYLPMQHTDFIFSIIAEETGFIGCIFLISLYVLFLYFGLRIAWNIKNEFASFSIFGFVILITLQSAINMAVATGLVPTKGMGLPFISYGNTALVCNLWMIGLIITMVHDQRT